jgi:hypothetical protein
MKARTPGFAVPRNTAAKWPWKSPAHTPWLFFSNWEHGPFVDFDILRIRGGEIVACKAGLVATDDNFIAIFAGFMENYRSVID